MFVTYCILFICIIPPGSKFHTYAVREEQFALTEQLQRTKTDKVELYILLIISKATCEHKFTGVHVYIHISA